MRTNARPFPFDFPIDEVLRQARGNGVDERIERPFGNRILDSNYKCKITLFYLDTAATECVRNVFFTPPDVNRFYKSKKNPVVCWPSVVIG